MKRDVRIVTMERIATTDDVLRELQLIDEQLDEFGLGHFRLFNHAYLVVTKHIHQELKNGFFKEPQLIDAFIVIFVDYYFRALNDITTGNLSKTSPWSKMHEYEHIKSAPVFLSLLIGANAHINYDLPQALRDFVRERGDEHSLADLSKLSTLLMNSGKEITTIFDEPNKFYDFLKRRFRFLYYRPAMYTILYWRIVAWRNYTRLHKSDRAMLRISKRSLRIGRLLLKIAQILGHR